MRRFTRRPGVLTRLVATTLLVVSLQVSACSDGTGEGSVSRDPADLVGLYVLDVADFHRKRTTQTERTDPLGRLGVVTPLLRSIELLADGTFVAMPGMGTTPKKGAWRIEGRELTFTVPELWETTATPPARTVRCPIEERKIVLTEWSISLGFPHVFVKSSSD